VATGSGSWCVIKIMLLCLS